MIYTEKDVQFLGEALVKPDPDTDAWLTKSRKDAGWFTREESGGAADVVTGIASAAGDIFPAFFKYKTEQLHTGRGGNGGNGGNGDNGGMSKTTKTALIIGGGVAAAGLLLFVAMK